MKYLFIILLITSGCDKKNPANNSKEPELRLLWSYEFKQGSNGKAKPLEENADFVFVSGDNGLTKLNYENGEEIWTSSYDGYQNSIKSSSFVSYNHFISGLIPRRVIAWNKNNGNIVWEYTKPDTLELAFLTNGATDGKHFIYGGDWGELYGFDIETGNLNFFRKFPRYVHEVAALEGGDILVTQGDTLLRYNVAADSIVWIYGIEGRGSFGGSKPIVEEGKVYAGLTRSSKNKMGAFVCLNVTTGEEIWRTDHGELAVMDYTISETKVFTQNKLDIIALDKQTGEYLWKSEMALGGPSESTRVDYLQGYVYWAHWSGIHVYDEETGEQVLYHKPEGSGYFWTSSAGKERYYAQSTWKLYAFEPLRKE